MNPLPEIFDRDNIVRVIHSNCLETERGAGTVLLSPEKSGKSHLLEYLYRYRSEQQYSLYCWVSVDALAAKVRPGQTLSDDLFLRYFLKQLHEELCTYLLRERDRGETARLQVQQDEARLSDGQLTDNELRKILETKVAANRAFLVELEILLKYRDQIPSLISTCAKTEPLYEFVDELFAKLKRMKKRVVLFIDDVHKIIRNHEFSEALLSTLRGMNSDGSLVPLLSSPLQLMDPSLHTRKSKRGDQTRSLFNDVKVEVLNSFTDNEALNFLTWPQPVSPPFTLQEQQYILDLAGGSPHFLKEVRDRFLRDNRPKLDTERKTFEKDTGRALAAAFETVWGRCTKEQRNAARSALIANADVPSADLGPVTCFSRSPGGAFSLLFKAFLATKKDDDLEDVTVTAAPAFRIFPTALCIADPDSARPLLTLTITNPTERTVRVKVECELEQYSLPCTKVAHLAPNETQNVEMSITLKHRSAADLRNPEPTQIRYKVEKDPGASFHLIDENTIRVRILALDQFIFASRDEVQNKILDYSWLIAAWVDPEDTAVQKLVAEASTKLKEQEMMASGYPAVAGPAAEAAITAQVSELYAALSRHGIAYQNRTEAPFRDRQNFSQRVRLPGRSLADGCANCLDGAVLFASLLAAFDLDPVILFLPDHALVGWKTSRGPMGQLKFLEITDVVNKDFGSACKNGQARYNLVQNMISEQPEGEITDIGNFAFVVDIRGVWNDRQLGILLGV